jgi:hypothetical protein
MLTKKGKLNSKEIANNFSYSKILKESHKNFDFTLRQIIIIYTKMLFLRYLS